MLLIGDLRALEMTFLRAASKGRRPLPTAVDLALESLARTKTIFPEHVDVIVASLPWLSGRAAARERAA